ncbi:MAG: hypothetical protein WBC21_00885 [Minisyncoccales bacterium]
MEIKIKISAKGNIDDGELSENFPIIIDFDEFVKTVILERNGDAFRVMIAMLDQLEVFHQYFGIDTHNILCADIETLIGYRRWLANIVYHLDRLRVLYRKDRIIYQITEKQQIFSDFLSVVKRNIEAIVMFSETDQIRQTAIKYLIFTKEIDEFHIQVKELKKILEKKIDK